MNTRSGFSLLELMTSVAILGIVSGMLFMLAGSLHAAGTAQEAKLTTQDDARAGMEFIVRELRQAAGTTITGVPGPSISYRIAEDVDGNGSAVDSGGNLELSPVRTLGRDVDDVNEDGVADTQLVRVIGEGGRPVTNGLLIDEDRNNSGTLDAAEDLNRNNVLDRGLWFERVGQGIRVTLQTQRRAGPSGLLMTSTLTEIVVPRN